MTDVEDGELTDPEDAAAGGGEAEWPCFAHSRSLRLDLLSRKVFYYLVQGILL